MTYNARELLNSILEHGEGTLVPFPFEALLEMLETLLSEQEKMKKEIAELRSDEDGGWAKYSRPAVDLTKQYDHPIKTDDVPKMTIQAFVGDKLVGNVQSFELLETAPHTYYTTPARLAVSRILFDINALQEVFGGARISLATSQRYPLQVIAKEGDKEVARINNAWITETGYSYTTDEQVIAECVVLEAESIKFNDPDVYDPGFVII